VPLSVQLDVRTSSAYDILSYCLLLDGAALTMQDPPWTANISSNGPHRLMLIAWVRSRAFSTDYRFKVWASHDFALTGDAAPAIRLVLEEKRGESRWGTLPTVEWYPNVGMARPPGWSAPDPHGQILYVYE
jgi:hypothetical protein